VKKTGLTIEEMLDKYFLKTRLPTIWCAGCGLGGAVGAFVRSFHASGIDRDKTVLVNGIGCSGRTAAYLDFDVLKGTHGRAITFATGIKLFRPELKVVVMVGDGDAAAIGGNHLIHAARRDVGLTVIVFNNRIYGMTGGQVSPTTPTDARAATAPTGNTERPFDLCRLVTGAGATFVGRGTSYHIPELERLLLAALRHPGFSLVEVMSPCPEQFGHYNKVENAAAMMLALREQAVRVQSARGKPPGELNGKFLIGELVHTEPAGKEKR
jgi:2-oxoglutarate/2-oxoacid ferredoxin oxidoreductase subunit beta